MLRKAVTTLGAVIILKSGVTYEVKDYQPGDAALAACMERNMVIKPIRVPLYPDPGCRGTVVDPSITHMLYSSGLKSLF